MNLLALRIEKQRSQHWIVGNSVKRDQSDATNEVELSLILQDWNEMYLYWKMLFAKIIGFVYCIWTMCLVYAFISLSFSSSHSICWSLFVSFSSFIFYILCFVSATDGYIIQSMDQQQINQVFLYFMITSAIQFLNIWCFLVLQQFWISVFQKKLVMTFLYIYNTHL